MDIWNSIKTTIYMIAGILIIIFNKAIFAYVEYVVSAVIIAYGINFIIRGITNKSLFKDTSKLVSAVTNILVGIALILTGDDPVTLCVIWGVWSILREGTEIAELLPELIEKKVGFLDLAESIAIIVLSFILIMEPTEHHIQFHIIILGIELILEVLFPLFNKLIEKIYEKVKAKRTIKASEDLSN